MKRTIKDFRISWEADHEQYWQGHSISFTKWDASATGVGDTLREALEDALDQLAQDDIEPFVDDVDTPLTRLYEQVSSPKMLDRTIVEEYCDCINCPMCCGAVETGSDDDPDEHNCAACAGECHFYVNIDVQLTEEEQ